MKNNIGVAPGKIDQKIVDIEDRRRNLIFRGIEEKEEKYFAKRQDYDKQEVIKVADSGK